MIRAGERMVVEEKTAVVDARLEAVALEPGWPGTEIGVRLAIGGKRLRAVVLGPGRARLLPGKGMWR
jgi:flagella basal body P-ring formation protein FlgA